MLGRVFVGLLGFVAFAGGGLAAADDAAPAAVGTEAPLSLSIADALKAAIPSSEAMTAAKAQVEVAEATLGGARAGWLPQLSASATYDNTIVNQYKSNPAAAFFQPDHRWRVDGTLSQMIFDGGRTSAGIRAAEVGVKLQKMQLKSQRAATVVEVAQAYYDAALAERQVEIAQASLDQAEQTLVSSKLGFEQGATPEFDMLRAEVARDNQVATLIQYKSQRDVAMVALKRLVGAPLDRPLVLVSKLDVDDAELQVRAAEAVAEVSGEQRANLEVEAAKGAVEQTQAQVAIAKADRLPQIDASTTYGYLNEPVGFIPDSNGWAPGWTVGVGASIPIFDGFRTRAAVRSAKAERAAAEARLRDTKRLAEVSEVQADSAVAAATATSKQSARTVTQAKRAYEIAELRYKQGSSTHLELVDARVQLEQALLHQAQSSRDLRVALLRRSLLSELPIARSF